KIFPGFSYGYSHGQSELKFIVSCIDFIETGIYAVYDKLQRIVICFCEQHGKLISACAKNIVIGPEYPLKDISSLTYHLVASRMAVSIVSFLQTIHVYNDYPYRILPAFPKSFQLRFIEGSVVKPCKDVMSADILELLFIHFSVGYITDDYKHFIITGLHESQLLMILFRPF